MGSTATWKSLPKIDAHVHVVLHQREGTDLRFNPPDAMLREMDVQRVERAVVLPINYPGYFPLCGEEREDWLRASNNRQAEIAASSEGRLIPFADCAIDGPYGHPSRGVAELRRAIEELGLAGLKIHASNLKVSADEPRLAPWIDAAARLGVPIVFHSNPSAYDPVFYGSSPARICQAAFGHEVTYVVAHMGGLAYHETLTGTGYVDLSATLPTVAGLLGSRGAEALLRSIGIDRLLFATDYPIFSYETYYEILDAMNFTADEVERIAWKNAERMLSGLPPAGSD